MEVHRIKVVNIWGIIIQIILCPIFSTQGSIFSNESHIESKMISKYLLFTNQECNIILHQFDEIIDDLETLKAIFILSSNEPKLRLLRSLSRRSKCTISKDKLTNLKSEIEGVLANVSNSNNLGSCTLNLNDPDNCNELTKVLQCSIQHLKNGFVDAVASNNGSIQEILKWQNTYESLLEKYKKQSGNLNQSLSQDNQLKFDKLQTDFQNLGKSLNTALDRLESTTISLCVLEMKHGQLEEAIDHSKHLKPSSISEIIKQSYCVGNDTVCLKICENIGGFIAGQSDIDNYVIGCETFYKEMESKNDFMPLKVFYLGLLIKGSPAEDRLQDIFKNIEPTFNETAKIVFEAVGKAIGEAIILAIGSLLS